MFRVVVVGAGRWGKVLTRNIEATAGYALAGVVNSNPETKQVISKAEYDALVIASPPDTHAEYVKIALDRGIPAFVEKPLSLSLEETITLHNLIEKRSGVTLVDHIHLFNPAYEHLRERLNTKTIRRIEAVGGGIGPHRDYSALWDYGPHDLSMILDLVGAAPLKLSVVEVDKSNDGCSVRVDMTFPDSLAVSAHFGNNFSAKARKLTVFTNNDEEYVLDDLIEETLVRKYPNGDRQVLQKKSLLQSPVVRALEIFRDDWQTQKDRRWGTGLSVDIARVITQIENSINETN